MSTELTTILAKIGKMSEKINQILLFSTNRKKFHTKLKFLAHLNLKAHPS